VPPFFFGKSDFDRNNSPKLVATIEYQVHKQISDVRQYMLNAVEEDPLIFARSLFTQFTTLVVQPLQAAPLFEFGFFDQIGAPRVIDIDGLDECINRREQKDILLTTSRITQQHQLLVLFKQSSRTRHRNHPFFLATSRHIYATLSYFRHEFEKIKTTILFAALFRHHGHLTLL